MAAQNHEPDCPANMGSSGSFNFLDGSTYAAGLKYGKTGQEHSNDLRRSRPRMKKLRRKHIVTSRDGSSVEFVLGSNGTGNVSRETAGDDGARNAFASCNGKSLSGMDRDFVVNMSKSGNSDRSGLGFNGSIHGFGAAKVETLFDSSSKTRSSIFYSNGEFSGTNGSSKLGVGKESETFVFGATNDCSKNSMNGDNSGDKNGVSADTKSSSCQFIFCAVKSESGGISKLGVKESSEEMRQHKGTMKNLSGLDKYGPRSNAKLSQEGVTKPGWHDSLDEFDRVDGAGFDTGACMNESMENTSNSLGQESGYTGKNESCTDASNVVPDVSGKVKLDTFGNPKKIHQTCFQVSAGLSHGKCNNHVNADGLEEHKRDSGPDFKFDSKISMNSSDSFEKCPVSNLSEEMKKLNIENSEPYCGNSNSFSSEFPVGADKVFVFKTNHKDSSSVKHLHPANISGNTPDMSDFPKDDAETHGLTAPGSSTRTGSQFSESEVPPMQQYDKDDVNFTQNMNGFNASGAGLFPPNLKFDFSNICNGTHNLDPANTKSLRTRRLKKNEKIRQRSMVKQLFRHDTPSPSREAAAAADQKAAADGSRGSPNDNHSNLNFPPSLHGDDGLSSIARQYRKTYKLKGRSSRSVLCDNFDKERPKQVFAEGTPYEVCERWRIRGNQAYQAGKISEAEELYTLGINTSAQYRNTPECPTEPFLLCYSNRAATRMTLGRMREAIEDCKMASAIDPNFLKVTLRAGNCYLVLGEIEDAIQRFSKCLGCGTDVCLDRRFKIEAADGLQKAKGVAEKMSQSSKLLQEGTISSADSALVKISEALAISRYSERLLKMKGEALCILRMFDEVIQLCDQTIDSAKKNLAADQSVDPRGKNPCELWRLHLLIKSHYHMGRLDKALDLIEQENIPLSSKLGNANEEPPSDLGITICQLICSKKSGNESFRSGKFAEAIEHYTAAITKSYDSGPFMAICFCNRAAAYQSINQVVDAILDCSLALALDENYQKAISRRATLYEMIRDYKQAADDVKRLMSLLEKQLKVKNQQADPQSKSSGGTGKDLRRARRHLSTIEEKAEIPLDFYLILGIKATDTEAEIKKAYRKAALKHHPDKAGHVLPRSDVGDGGTLWKEVGKKIHDDADRLFKIIGEAYSVLSDQSKRSKYDSDEEMRNNIIREGNSGSSNSGHPSTSYSSPPSGCWTEKSRNFGGRNSRRYWYGSGSHYSQARW